MFKKMIKGLVIGGAALTIASSAFAESKVIELNIYGASAQYSFWTTAAPKFMRDTTANGGYNCGTSAGKVYHAINATQRSAKTQDRDMGIAVCKGKAVIDGSSIFDGVGTDLKDDTVVIRYTSNASYDGIYAVTGSESYSPDYPDCLGGERKQPVVNSAAFVDYSVSTTPGQSISSMACMPVNVGASDVAASTFGQTSWGDEFGNDTSNVNNELKPRKSFYGIAEPDTDLYTSAQPLVVPFGFYANTQVPFNNLTRPMAVNLFAGKIANWNQFGVNEAGEANLPNLQVTVCMRHAGSGTHATLDAAIMRADAPLKRTQQDIDGGITEETAFMSDDVDLGTAPFVFFNKGTTEELNCVKAAGAIGYADADKNPPTGTKRMKYNGVDASAKFVKNGQYDFWSAQWLYYPKNDGAKVEIKALLDWAAVGTNLPGYHPTTPTGKALYWVAKNDMNFLKANDFKLPIKKQ